MEFVTIWYYITNAGDGSAYLTWLLSKEDAEKMHELDPEPWAEECHGSIGTIKGCPHHLKAILKSYILNNLNRKGNYCVVNPETFEVVEVNSFEEVEKITGQFVPKFRRSDLYDC